MRHTFQWRISLFSIIVLIAAVVCLAYLSNTYFQNSYQNNWENSLVREAQSLSIRASPEIASGPPYSVLSNLSEQYAQEREYSLTILLSDGTMVSQPATPSLQIANPINIPEVQSAINGQGAASLRPTPANSETNYFIGEPIKQSGQVIGAVLLVAPFKEIELNILDLRHKIILASLILSIISITLILIIHHFSFRTLRGLVKRIPGQGLVDIENSFINKRDEIRQLDRAFNNLSTQLNQQVSELETERNSQAKILEQMTDNILITDSEGIIRVINPAACSLFNISKAQALDHSITVVVRYHQLVDLWSDCRSSGEQQSRTLEISPSYRYIHGIATPLLSNGLPENYLLVFQDFSRLRRLENVRRDFVSNVSHELRTPLASLKALVETLASGAMEDPPAAQRFLSRMESEIDNMTQVVQELLELTRIESGKMPLEKKEANPCQLLQAALERMQVQAERAHLNLSSQCPAGLPFVEADPNRIGQVLINLIHNAIKFTPPGGSIQASAREENDIIVFAIKDTGVGMEPQILERIFERFYKADRARSSDGTGLGLSIARHLVEAHGGQIWVESKINQGSTFYFSLPKA